MKPIQKEIQVISKLVLLVVMLGLVWASPAALWHQVLFTAVVVSGAVLGAMQRNRPDENVTAAPLHLVESVGRAVLAGPDTVLIGRFSGRGAHDHGGVDRSSPGKRLGPGTPPSTRQLSPGFPSPPPPRDRDS
jgi:hypothetical protein